MSLWPCKVTVTYMVPKTVSAIVNIDYEEFAQWSGTTLHEADERLINDYLEAGDEYRYLCTDDYESHAVESIERLIGDEND